ncbi:[Fe-Fe] hydrogenase large subunit C-terminal domain-containing protein [Acetivibrio cellulolyticus]|uniref:[Fe-Fe] hydrogenase large subunit C-terminal domain-containing protein n=1 Tax=Acetivibrio cellulolyticus TaxID=35830 RepID=UPI0002481BDF|nr:[Fe-Fe] hydrogenase large subunit C-terminal domain-containing protein [Acetivibrio cellulolyticus]
MANRFAGFQEKRMKIFGEIVEMYWNDRLNTADDLNKLADDIRVKYNFTDQDLPFIKDHIRIAMGLDPKGGREFSDELDIVKKSEAVGETIIAKIDGACKYCEDPDCSGHCKYEAQIYRRNEGPVIENNKCLSCGGCVVSCDFGALADKIEFIPLIDLLKSKSRKVFAVVAPAIAGQFGEDVTLGQLRSAFRVMGFEDMIEVAMFADILSIREAFEFSSLVKTEKDFFLTSCCCPVWFNLTRKGYPEMYRHMSPSVSPMIASGRFLKELYKDAAVVFFAPCIAKKAEINEPELHGAIDFVINFRELAEIFNALEIHPKDLPGDEKDQASLGGRLYAKTGGVSFSVKTVVNRLEPSRVIKLKSKRVDGVKNCKELLDRLNAGEEIDANFIEGMGCSGGCVGGPKTNIDADRATRIVNETGEDSYILTPFDNMNVMIVLRQSGIHSIEEIVQNRHVSELLKRE